MADVNHLNDEVKKLKDTLSQGQKEQLDNILKIASSVLDSLEREFKEAFTPGAERLVLKYRNGEFTLAPAGLIR